MPFAGFVTIFLLTVGFGWSVIRLSPWPFWGAVAVILGIWALYVYYWRTR